MAQLAPGAMALGGAVANQQVTKWRFLNMEKHGKTWKNMEKPWISWDFTCFY